MVILKSKHEIEAIRKACQVVAECHRTIAPLIKPGITTNEIERIFEVIILKHGAKPYEKGYKGYQYATCASVNDVIAHGFPSDKPLEEGDIVTIDTVAELDGWLGDVTSAIQQHAESHGFGVVRDLLAHGIGRGLHEEPTYMHVGKPGKGLRIKEGMVFTIEPMITEGTYYMTIDPDGWTARTLDRKLAAQYEHTVAITAEGPQILTAQ
ncbi:type I methionyl aminopeptidase [Paenibacillus sp. NPDC058910]|uniref:type I methionyl aminopeptidase n=1 Tax=unclassified Paenibacillus TaxID=185978 RepID=UPI0036CB038D